jgi:hypothetical protein
LVTMVEVGGVEPPSENLSVKASTCLAVVFVSLPRDPVGRILSNQPIHFRPVNPGPGSPGLAYLSDALFSPGRRGEEDVAAS